MSCASPSTNPGGPSWRRHRRWPRSSRNSIWPEPNWKAARGAAPGTRLSFLPGPIDSRSRTLSAPGRDKPSKLLFLLFTSRLRRQQSLAQPSGRAWFSADRRSSHRTAARRHGAHATSAGAMGGLSAFWASTTAGGPASSSEPGSRSQNAQPLAGWACTRWPPASPQRAAEPA